MNYHRKATTILMAASVAAALILNSFPASIIAVASIGLYGFWCKIEPRKLDVTEQTMKEINTKLNALMLKSGMVR